MLDKIRKFSYGHKTKTIKFYITKLVVSQQRLLCLSCVYCSVVNVKRDGGNRNIIISKKTNLQQVPKVCICLRYGTQYKLYFWTRSTQKKTMNVFPIIEFFDINLLKYSRVRLFTKVAMKLILSTIVSELFKITCFPYNVHFIVISHSILWQTDEEQAFKNCQYAQIIRIVIKRNEY